MTTMSANEVKRIDLPIDYSLLNHRQAVLIGELLWFGESDFNAPCYNRQARIKELTVQLKGMSSVSPESTRIESELAGLNKGIYQDKLNGLYIDYGGLKRRIANGARWEDIYSEAPFFYARAWDIYRQFSGSNSRRDKGGGIINGISKLAPAVATILRSANKWS